LKRKTIKLFDFLQGRTVEVSREIAKIEASEDGPNLVFIGGMHGNEPTGILALKRVTDELKKLSPLMKGNVYALAGNLTALERGERFIVSDLNRIWQADMVEKARKRDYEPDELIHEVEEQVELWGYIDDLMARKKGPFIFADLHTTSVKSAPFITMSDTIMNRQYAKQVPVPVVIGIEEHLNEPLLSYVNDLGCVSMAFEGGQHHDPESVRNHESLIWILLKASGIMKKIEIPMYRKHYDLLRHNAEHNHSVYEIRMRQALENGDEFEMFKGFENFQPVKEGQELARLNGEILRANEDALIFMPLYQKQGNDAYFLVRKINKFWLGVSFIFRRFGFNRLLPLLPGVSPYPVGKHVMKVDPDVAKWYSTEILHLMGYRRKKNQESNVLFVRRKYDYKGPEKS
jgi:succinylglutamate desuccinylase